MADERGGPPVRRYGTFPANMRISERFYGMDDGDNQKFARFRLWIQPVDATH